MLSTAFSVLSRGLGYACIHPASEIQSFHPFLALGMCTKWSWSCQQLLVPAWRWPRCWDGSIIPSAGWSRAWDPQGDVCGGSMSRCHSGVLSPLCPGDRKTHRGRVASAISNRCPLLMDEFCEGADGVLHPGSGRTHACSSLRAS